MTELTHAVQARENTALYIDLRKNEVDENSARYLQMTAGGKGNFEILIDSDAKS